MGQVSDLVGWVKDLQERAAGPSETSLTAQQVGQNYVQSCKSTTYWL